MNLDQYKTKALENVIEPMISFMEEWEDCDYSADDIEACKSLIYAYLEGLSAIKEPTEEKIMEQVKNLVLGLNGLNETTDYALIETDAREAICELIQTSAIDCGLIDNDEDITEEWRAW